MDIFSIDNIIVTIFGYNLSLLELLTTIGGLGSVFFAAQGKSFNFWIGYVYTFLLFFVFLQKQYYSSMLLQPVSLGLTILGHYRWTHPRTGEENKKHELKVTLLTNKQRLFHIALAILVMIVWGFALSKIHLFFDMFDISVKPASRPFIDSFATAMIITAQYLSAQKKLDCWAAWMIVNIMNFTMYVLAGFVFLPMMSTMYMIFAVYGAITWYKEMKEKK